MNHLKNRALESYRTLKKGDSTHPIVHKFYKMAN